MACLTIEQIFERFLSIVRAPETAEQRAVEVSAGFLRSIWHAHLNPPADVNGLVTIYVKIFVPVIRRIIDEQVEQSLLEKFVVEKLTLDYGFDQTTLDSIASRSFEEYIENERDTRGVPRYCKRCYWGRQTCGCRPCIFGYLGLLHTVSPLP